VRCNEHIKFAALLDKAVALGFDAVCTGHYARIEVRDDGTRALHRARDAAKDQSYVLAVMGPERLARSLFPLGDVTSKDETRAEAAARGLSVSAKPDSYDICFVADGDTQGFLRDRLGSREGDIVDTSGEVLGRHDGAYAYTVGQRKGLALGRPAPDGRPRYVLAVEPVRNRVVVGSVEELAVGTVDADRAVWFAAPGPTPFACEVQVRAHGAPVPAVATVAPDGAVRVDVAAAAGLRGVAPGQSLVVYDGTRVLGQATVTGTRRPSSAADATDAADAAAGAATGARPAGVHR
jgi:tRNA-specific 2-thiouridylase